MDNNMYKFFDELTDYYLFEKETTIYLLNVSCDTIFRGGVISRFNLGDNTFIEASIPNAKVPLLLLFCSEDNLFTVRELCFKGNYYDIELTLEEMGIRFELKSELSFPRLARMPLKDNKELMVGSSGYSVYRKNNEFWEKWYYFKTQSVKAFIEKEDFKLFSFEWRSYPPIKTKAKNLAMKMINGKKVTLNNLRKILVCDEKELETQMQEICEIKTSEFTLNTYHEGVGYRDSKGLIRIKDREIGIPDFFIIKVFKAGMEKNSREVIKRFFSSID